MVATFQLEQGGQAARPGRGGALPAQPLATPRRNGRAALPPRAAADKLFPMDEDRVTRDF